MIQKTAILYFSRSVTAELNHKDFYKSDLSISKQIFRNLFSSTIKVIRKTNLPLIIFDENKQKGKSFGEKLSNAFQYVYDEGYDHVIAIGNDCPALDAKTLLQAASSLHNGKSVIGPANDGGVYLIGISKKYFNDKQIASLNWQTKEICQELLTTLSTTGSAIEQTALLSDIDTENDFLTYNTTIRWIGFVRSEIRKLMLRFFKPDNKQIPAYSFSTDFLLRGPPQY